MHIIHNPESYEPDTLVKGGVIVVLFSPDEYD